MRTVIDASEETSVETVVTATDRPATLTTTLYDLIAAVQDVAGPDNDALIVATVQHLLHAGLVTWGNGVVAYGNRRPDPLGETQAHGGFRITGRRWIPERLPTIERHHLYI